MRFGFYEPVRDMYTKIICGQNHTGSTPFAVKLLSGLTTGAVAILIASPTDLVKVRMQAQKLVEGVAPKYPNALAAYRIILMEEGLAGIWNGVSPNILRSTIVSAVELGTYDHVKEELLKFGMQESPLVHVVAAFVTGFAAVIATNPADVLKSRLMSDTKGAYRGLRDCAWKTMAKDGPLAFYKGFSPSFARSASWCVVSFMTLEQIKELTGIKKKELEPSPEPELMIQPQELEPSPEPAQDPEPEHMIQPSPEPERRKMLNASV
jgi:solute carrier family 25 uncoupling protein 8/9